MTDEPRIAAVHERLLVGLSCREALHTGELRQAGVTHWADHRRTECPPDVLEHLPAVQYLWNPIRDDGLPKPIEWYDRTVSFARAAFGGSQSVVLVTCARGEHRGPSMAYAIQRAVLSRSRTDALDALQHAWPRGDPYYSHDIDTKLALLHQ